MMTRTLAPAALVALFACHPAAGQISLDSLTTGSEGNTRFSDTTPLGIDSSGDGFVNQFDFQDFAVTGSVTQNDAFNTLFSLTLNGMSNVDLTSGAKLADGGIDRSGNGDLGIRSGSDNGINQLEGYLLGIDASELDSSLAFQLTGVGVAFVGGTETGRVVNRNNIGQSLSFGATGTGSDVELSSGLIDVSGLGLTVNGGDTDNELASLFANDFGAGGFRFTGFEIDVVSAVPQSEIVLDSLPTGSEANDRFFDRSSFSVDSFGNAFTIQASPELSPFQDFDVTGTVLESAAFDTEAGLILQGISSVDTITGEKLVDGGIDRAGNGDLGIRQGDGNGIEQEEGYLLGLDSRNLDPSLAYQITDIGVAFLDGAETGKIVNRNDTSKVLTFGAGGNDVDVNLSTGFIDVTSLDLIVAGGLLDQEIASIFGDSFGAGGFRITGFKLGLADNLVLQSDFDGDGDVDVDDFNSWQSGFGALSGSSQVDGDADGDGDVDGLDILTWQRQFLSSLSSSSEANAVPEPAACVLIVISLAGLRRLRGDRSRV